MPVVYGKVKQEAGEQGGNMDCGKEDGCEGKEGGWDRGLWNSPGGCRVGMVGTTVVWLFVLENS